MNKGFPIKLITKNSILNDLFLALMLVVFIALFIFYVSMSPSEGSSNDLKALWFMEGIPLWVKQVALYGLLTLILAVTINLLNKRSRMGKLWTSDEEITITTRKKLITLKYETIKEVAFVGKSINYKGEESENFKIFFKTKTEEVVRIKLLYYLMVDG